MFRIEDTDAQIRKLGLWFVIISLHFFFIIIFIIIIIGFFFIPKYRLGQIFIWFSSVIN